MSSEQITSEQALEAIDGVGYEGEPFSADEFARELGCGTDIAVTALEELVEQGEIQTKRIDSMNRVWWRRRSKGKSDNTQFHSLVGEVEDYAIFMLDPDGNVRTGFSWKTMGREFHPTNGPTYSITAIR